MIELGDILFTPGALLKIPLRCAYTALWRHMACDWGVVSKDDWKRNDYAVRHGERILSAYRTDAGTKFWIITERDRSCTTVLLPDEY